MKLYHSPMACSLADHVALEEGGAPYESERVDLQPNAPLPGGTSRKIDRNPAEGSGHETERRRGMRIEQAHELAVFDMLRRYRQNSLEV